MGRGERNKMDLISKPRHTPSLQTVGTHIHHGENIGRGHDLLNLVDQPKIYSLPLTMPYICSYIQKSLCRP